LVAVDYGYVTVNYDKTALQKLGLAVPKTLADLALPAYKNTLVVQNPATSSSGNAFLLATIAGLGEAAAFDWWQAMRKNGVKVTKGWTEAYNSDFSRNGGKYPFVVSYASSPAAELFYSTTKLAQAPTASLDLLGGVFRQVEGIALIKQTTQIKQTMTTPSTPSTPSIRSRLAAIKFIQFMRSAAVQTGLQTTVWMQPADATTKLDAALLAAGSDALSPKHAVTLPSKTITAKNAAWVTRWTKTVLK
jgi:thiamine transport system substrate-binding protein